ncbi:substrate-binding periplasmic protein [Coralliovum pocilloporae]|uniref:substrate-binding periplasmic protein n=1 Tax=Coralliovum pocilloporae TaxID=3066369 RepID=UPI0033070FFD
MIRFPVLILLLAVFVGGPTGPASAQPKSLTIVADDWPPYSGSQLPGKGLSLELISTVLNRAGYETRVLVEPWARIMEGARNGRYDIVGSLFLTDDLKETMVYSSAYYTTKVRFLKALGSPHQYTTLDALKPYSIAVGDGFLYAEDFDNAAFLNKVVVTTTLQCVHMVAHERADLTLDSEEVIKFALNQEAPELKNRVEFVDKPLAERGIHMAIRKSLPNHDIVLEDFNRELDAMRADGSYDALVAKHLASLE